MLNQRMPLVAIVRATHLPSDLVKSSLIVLMQHHIAIAREVEGSPITYELNVDRILSRARFPFYIDITYSTLGPVAGAIMEALLLHGHLRVVRPLAIVMLGSLFSLQSAICTMIEDNPA